MKNTHKTSIELTPGEIIVPEPVQKSKLLTKK